VAAPSYVAQGATQFITTAGAMPYPAGLAAGDFIIMVVSSSVTGIGNAPAGWTEIGTLTTAGSMSTRRWGRIATGTESGTSTVNVTSGVKGIGYTVAYRPAIAGGVLAAAAITTGADTTSNSTAYSAAGSSWTIAVDDRIVLATIILAASGAFTGNSTGITLTQTSAVFSKTDRFAGRTGPSSDNTLYYGHSDASVTTGSTNAPTLAETTVGANGTGHTSFIRITETPAPLIPQIVPTRVAVARAATR
jgi:hypothetical protein